MNPAAILIPILLVIGIVYCFFLYAKRIFLPKSRMHIAIGLIPLGIALNLVKGSDANDFGKFLIVVGILATALSIFIAKDLAGKYQPYLRKGKSTTAEQLASTLSKKSVEVVLFELHCLFDRGYLPGFTLNMETHAITPAVIQDTVKEIVHKVSSTVSTIKGTPGKPTTCPGCGATISDTGAANCEFCGSPMSR